MTDCSLRGAMARLAMRATRPAVLEYDQDVKMVTSMNRSRLQRYQQRRLKQLLYHAAQTTEYYQAILSDAGVYDGDTVTLDRFNDIPLLTKTELRNEREQLHSSKPGQNLVRNTSGGTTGEPVEFLQDDDYLYWSNANRLHYHRLAGRDLGEPWVKLWGDDSDVFDERQGFKSRLSNFVLNRHVMNSYRMGDEEMAEYVERINAIQPKSMEVYVESMNELAKFIEQNDLDVHSPNGILTTAGTLYEPVRERIEHVFDAPVLNKYGSREVGTVACEAPEQEGLRIFDHTHYVEVVDEEGNPLPAGEEGEIAITLLTNYTMPLIRYRIGDMGIMRKRKSSDTHPFSTLERVTGRVTDHFVTTDGTLVYGEIFTHMLYSREWVTKFQVRQTSTDQVLYRIVMPEEASPPQSEVDEIIRKTQSVLGEETTVDFEYVDEIEESDSGKYRYTVSEVV